MVDLGEVIAGVSLIDAVVVVGVAVVLPLVYPARWRAWEATAVALAVSFLLPRGVAAACLAAPLVVAAAWNAVVLVRATGWRGVQSVGGIAGVATAAWAAVAAGAIVMSRAGIEAFGIHEPIVELTTVHYLFAGTGALTLACGAFGRSGGPNPWGKAAVLLTMSAPPVVATGFFTGAALPQVGGAVMMTLGVWLTSSLELRDASRSKNRRWGRGLLAISGLAVWVPMVLAVAWALGQHWDVPALSIPDMARTHGVANAFAFVICGLLGRRLLRDGDATSSHRDVSFVEAVR